MFMLSAIHFLASQPEILLDCIVFVCLFVFFPESSELSFAERKIRGRV